MDRKEPATRQLDENITLYFHPYNFYCQKVLLILYEKNIEFKTHIVDLCNGEQYSSWFLDLNPKGDVPVLRDGSLVIPNSTDIINYLGKKFENGKNQLLSLENFNAAERKKKNLYEQLLSTVPVGALSLGSFLHEDLKLLPKPPFVGLIRKSILKNNEKVYEILKKSAADVTNQSVALLRKLELQDRRKQLVQSREEFQKILDVIENILRLVEKDMQNNPDQEWLISSELTLVDISFGLFLHRLYQLGFENYFWAYGKLPLIESYFLRFRKRDSYTKIAPTNFTILKDIWERTPQNYKFGASILGMAMFAALVHK